MYLLMNAIDSPWRKDTFFHRFYVTHLLDVKENGTYSSVVNIERAYLEHPLWPDDYFLSAIMNNFENLPNCIICLPNFAKNFEKMSKLLIF